MYVSETGRADPGNVEEPLFTWRLISLNGIKIIAKTIRRVDDASVACVRHCIFGAIGKSWL